MERISIYNQFDIPGNASVKVRNMTSRRSGEAVKNQFVISGWGSLRFQSYATTCLVWDYDTGVLTVYPEAFNYSVTTSKYSRYFLEDECFIPSQEVNAIIKAAKTEDYGRDCPLYLKLR